AVKQGQRQVRPAGFQAMARVRCGGGCGEEFCIAHRIISADPIAAEKHAVWLASTLAAQHLRNELHPDCIELPD
ncbi:MAG TPA: hypothetical protein VLC12_04140, partial [Terriglobales bacterium]|nr:hypothetical protein [Terriglobales bacterium]